MTDRGLTTELEETFSSPVAGFVVFVFLDFPTDAVRIHNSAGTYEWGGFEWLGVGSLGGIDPIEETADLTSTPISMVLSSITQEIIDAVLDEDVKNRQCSVYVGPVDVEGDLLGTPHEWWTGFVSHGDLLLGEKNAVALTGDTLVSRLKRTNGRRYTLEDHQVDYPGDLFLEYLPYVVEAEVVWGGERVRAGFRNEEGFPGGDRPRRRRPNNRRNRGPRRNDP